jgi:hypothetical protein
MEKSMANEINDSAQDKRRYMFRKCPTCGVKLHVSAFTCWKCGNRYNFNANTGKWVDDVIYGSTNPNDAIYNRILNDVERCLTCQNTQRGKTCDHAYCFGSGRGRCDMCERYENTRFMCCQMEQERSGNKAGSIAPGKDPVSLFISNGGRNEKQGD